MGTALCHLAMTAWECSDIPLRLFSFTCQINVFLFNSIFILCRSSVSGWQCKVERCLDHRKSHDAAEGRKGFISFPLISSFSWDLPMLMAVYQFEWLGKLLADWQKCLSKTKSKRIYTGWSMQKDPLYVTGRKFVSCEFHQEERQWVLNTKRNYFSHLSKSDRKWYRNMFSLKNIHQKAYDEGVLLLRRYGYVATYSRALGTNSWSGQVKKRDNSYNTCPLYVSQYLFIKKCFLRYFHKKAW